MLSAMPIVCNANAKKIPITANFAIGAIQLESDLATISPTKLAIYAPAAKIITPKNT